MYQNLEERVLWEMSQSLHTENSALDVKILELPVQPEGDWCVVQIVPKVYDLQKPQKWIWDDSFIC